MNKDEHLNSLGIPEGYFDDLKMKIHREIETHEAEKFISDFNQGGLGFNIPENYFDHLKSDLKHFSKSDGSLNSPIWKWGSLIAACGIIAVMSVMIFNSSESQELASEKTFEELLAEIPVADDYLAYLEIEELEELSYNQSDIAITDENTIDFILEDQDLLDELTEDYLEF